LEILILRHCALNPDSPGASTAFLTNSRFVPASLRPWASAEILPGGEQRRHFAYLFQFVGEASAMQMDVHKKCPMLWQQLHKIFSLQENFTLRKYLF